ncbi:Ldh family oxidoreductase [Saccharopolyspora sp. NPDC050642]|uniref:Ldh family oxidoreductase n=1 Tax=Saccharopolyspora sp. NPDC050642 TaxID=3157099 RepID=UPI0033DEBD3D
MRERIVDRNHVIECIAERFLQAGYRAADAEITARHLVLADVAGYGSHGLRLVPAYLDELRRGLVDPRAAVELLSQENVLLQFDAHDSPGHPALAKVVDRCADVVREHGTALAWVRGLRHTGRLAEYLWRVVDRGMCGMLTVTSALDEHSALVAPPGSATRLLGSNPLAIGVSDGDGVRAVYDGSTAATPFYEVARRRSAGLPLDRPDVVDDAGRPTTDPDAFFADGAIRPFGGVRGFGLSTALAMLSQVHTAANERGRTNAFVVVFGAGASLAGIADQLREAGCYLPGSRRQEVIGETTIRIDADTALLLAESGVHLE